MWTKHCSKLLKTLIKNYNRMFCIKYSMQNPIKRKPYDLSLKNLRERWIHTHSSSRYPSTVRTGNESEWPAWLTVDSESSVTGPRPLEAIDLDVSNDRQKSSCLIGTGEIYLCEAGLNFCYTIRSIDLYSNGKPHFTFAVRMDNSVDFMYCAGSIYDSKAF